ncbi:unnamed protein product [marine sediment metagenome]|uniref:Uncharacterized protein n=1 Tax=marine sediment metagenome TaxID=412755 RepID=X1LTG6_9ZZZZ
METAEKKRSTAVTAIGLIAIAYAVYNVASGLWFFAVNMIGGAPLHLVLVRDIIIGTCIGYTGFYFLKLRTRAKSALEIIAWIVLVLRIASGIWWFLKWPIIMQQMSDANVTVSQSLWYNLFRLIGYNIIPLIAIIWLLRSKAVREAFIKPKS